MTKFVVDSLGNFFLKNPFLSVLITRTSTLDYKIYCPNEIISRLQKSFHPTDTPNKGGKKRLSEDFLCFLHKIISSRLDFHIFLLTSYTAPFKG